MAERHDSGVEREPVAETLPAAIRAQLEQMRGLAQPYLDRIVADFHANPTTLLDRLPAMQEATAIDEEELGLALLAAAMERRLDSDDEMWHTLMSTFHVHVVRRAGGAAWWLSDHPVIGALERVFVERWQEERAARTEPPQPEESWPRSLPPHLDERLQRHRFAAEASLKRIQAMGDGLQEVQQIWLESLRDGEPLDRDQLLADAGVEDGKDIARDLKQQPADVQVSIALAWLYERLNELPRSKVPFVQLWSELNRRTLPYDADDLELGLGLLAGHRYDWIFAKELVRAIERYSAKTGEIPERWRDSLRAILAGSAGSRRAEYQKMAVTIRSLLRSGGASERAAGASRLDVSSLDGADAWSSTVRARLSQAYGDDGGLNQLLGMLQDSGTAPRPSAAWRSRIGSALAASDASLEVVRMLLEIAIEVRDQLVRRTERGNWLYSVLGEPAALQIRAAAWAAQLSGAGWAPDLLERLAKQYAELLFDGKPHSARVVNGAASALALGTDRDSVVRVGARPRARR